ncbi:hypothetical protein RF679_09575 [Undibacterium cyanobacteriorum]|uniref:Uncharacterized protein n=1 Tax=Undibacterium cyanobacteriorum TaxID=3073561 RepID=A0ABY9RD65_9BURK|nr:hypothetical protein [Undibacterium sp. 20NA77.5]WMW78916.1 hypothetical protein RF679_09575 [Undibacterium sp. 20NA77.5]
MPIFLFTWGEVRAQKLIDGNAVGEFEINKPAPKLATNRILLRQIQTNENGDSFILIRARVASSLVEAEVVDDLVWRVSILKPGLMTKDRAQVGTSAYALVKRNPSLMPEVGPGPSLILVPSTPCGLSYVTDYEFKEKEYENLTHEKVLRIIGRSKVTRILAVGC